jgi:hypothetical protein
MSFCIHNSETEPHHLFQDLRLLGTSPTAASSQVPCEMIIWFYDNIIWNKQYTSTTSYFLQFLPKDGIIPTTYSKLNNNFDLSQ